MPGTKVVGEGGFYKCTVKNICQDKILHRLFCNKCFATSKSKKCCSYGGVFFVHQVKLGRPGNYVDLLVMAERFILGRKVFILMLFVEAPTM